MTLPTVTVVIPSYNRPERLRNCIHAIAALDYPSDLVTVEVVDDGSTVPLAPAIADTHCPFPFRVTRQPNRGPAAARNTGAHLAAGDMLAFTDDDCEPDSNWLMALAQTFERDRCTLIGGRVTNGIGGNAYAEASQDLADFLNDYYEADTGGAQFFTSNNLACARAVFLEEGGFDESFPLAAAEDRELGIRWRRHGKPLIFAPDAIVRHHHALDLRRFWRQHRNYGLGARHLHSVLRNAGAPRPRLERLGFYARLIAHPVASRRARGVPHAALMVLSQVAMAKGYFGRGG